MKLRILLPFMLLIGVFGHLPSAAQSPKSTPRPPSPQMPAASESSVTEPPHAMTADDVHAFLDGFVPMQLERENIAGAVVLVVKDGAIFFAKGYGYSDVEKKAPVTVDATLFRPGSISKLFTWTAVYATGGARQARSGPRHQRISGLQDSRRNSASRLHCATS